MWIKLTPVAGTLTRGRSLICRAETEVESPGLWAVCSITKDKYLKKRWAKLNAHSDASGDLCACSRITTSCRNRWHEISGACYECRWRSCLPTGSPMYRTHTRRWFLGLENFLIKSFHVVDVPVVKLVKVKDKDLDYISEAKHIMFLQCFIPMKFMLLGWQVKPY